MHSKCNDHYILAVMVAVVTKASCPVETWRKEPLSHTALGLGGFMNKSVTLAGEGSPEERTFGLRPEWQGERILGRPWGGAPHAERMARAWGGRQWP